MKVSNPLHALEFRGLGGQPPFEPKDLDRFLSKRRIATLAYTRRDGRPNQAPVWYTVSDGTFFLSTVSNGAKHLALQRSPQVTLSIQDERPPYRNVVIDGTVELSPLDPDNDPTAGVATRYFGRMGAAAYDRMTKEIYQASGLTIVKLVPTEIKGFDNTKAINKAELAFARAREALPIPRNWL